MSILAQYKKQIPSSLSEQIELNNRISVLQSAEAIIRYLPRENKEINVHYRIVKNFLESLCFVTETECRESDKHKKPVHTGYVDLIRSITFIRKIFLENLKTKKIKNCHDYSMNVETLIQNSLIKWINFRKQIQPLQGEKDD